MMRGMVIVGMLGITTWLAGCGGAPAPKVTAKVDVAGTVQLDGKPMDEPEGEIAFIAAGDAPVILPIKAGKFEGKGPVGDSRVEIRAWKTGEPIMMDGKPFGDPVKENYVAPQFSESSTLTAAIPVGGSKDLKFEVESKK